MISILATQTKRASSVAHRFPTRLRLRISQGPQSGTEWTVSRLSSFLIGSDPSCQGILTDPEAPRFAFQVMRGRKGLLVRSLTPAARRNDQVNFTPAQLRPGDRLSVAGTVLEVLRDVSRRPPSGASPSQSVEGVRPPEGRITAALHLIEHIATWEHRCDELERELDAARATLAQSRADQGRVEQQYQEAFRELLQLRDEQSAWVQAQQELQRHLQFAQETTVVQHLRQEQQEAEAAEQNRRLAAVQARVEELQSEATRALEGWMHERQMLVTMAEEKVAAVQEMQRKLQEAETERSARVEEAQRLQNAVNMLNGQILAAQTSWDQERAKTTADRNRLQHDYEALLVSSRSHQAELQSLQQQLQHALTERDAQAREVTRLKSVIQNLEKQFHAARAGWEQERAQLTTTCESANAELVSLRSSTAELEGATTRIQQLENQLQAAKWDLNERTASVEQLQQQIQQLEAARESAQQSWACERDELLTKTPDVLPTTEDLSHLRDQLQTAEAEAEFWKERAEEVNELLVREQARNTTTDAWHEKWSDSEPKNDPPPLGLATQDALDVLQEVRHTLSELRHSHVSDEFGSAEERLEERDQEGHGETERGEEEFVTTEAYHEVEASTGAEVEFSTVDRLTESLEPGGVPGEHEDESIELYMNRLLERIRGEQRSPRPHTVRPHDTTMVNPATVTETSTTPTSPASPTLPPPDAMVESQPASPARRAKPELVTDLAKMREIANTSARTAIRTSHHRNRIQDLLGRLTMAFGVLAMTSGVAYVVRSKPMLVGLVCSAGIWFCLWLCWPGLRQSVIGRTVEGSTGKEPNSQVVPEECELVSVETECDLPASSLGDLANDSSLPEPLNS